MKSNNLILLLSLIFFAITSISGCSTIKPECPESRYMLSGNLVSYGYQIADQLINNLNQPINKNNSVIVATIVNINNLEESSTFGRILSEYISSRFSQRGYKVCEMKFRQNSIFIGKEKGEFVLSRNIRDVSKEHNASAVVVGTYAESHEGIYVSARTVNPSDNTIISSCDYALKIGQKAQNILSKNN